LFVMDLKNWLFDLDSTHGAPNFAGGLPLAIR
jgi:hypothetical protein